MDLRVNLKRRFIRSSPLEIFRLPRIAVVVLFFLPATYVGAQAQLESEKTIQESEHTESFSIVCSGDSVTCSESLSKTVETTSTLAFRYQVPKASSDYPHCSPILFRVLVDGRGRYSKRMGWHGQPGSGALDTGRIELGPVSPGLHTLELQAVAHPGDCRQERLASWGGTLTTFTSVASGSPLVSRRLANVPGTPVIGEIHAAPVSGGELLILRASGNRREGIGVGLFPGVLPPQIEWRRLIVPGVSFNTFVAHLNGGTMVATVDDGNQRQGRDLAFVPGVSLASLTWQPLSASGLTPPTRAFKARIGAGSTAGTLVLLDATGSGKKSMALAFVPGSPIASLRFLAVASNLNPNRFSRATVPGGALIASSRTGVGLQGGGLDFLPGAAPARLIFQRIFNQGTTATLDSFDTVVNGKRLIYVTEQGNQKRAEDLVVVP